MELTFKFLVRAIIGAVVFIGLIITWFAVTQTINQGHAGVVYNRSHGVEEQTLGQGFKFVNPMERITEYPVSTETVVYEKLSLATKDGKPLDVDITMEYLNNVEKLPYIYNKFKGQKPEVIENTWLKARLKDSALTVTSKYTILQVFQEREKIRTDIQKHFKKDVEQHGFIVENIVFGTPVPDKNTVKAIQAVVDAQQQLEALKIEKEKAIQIAEKQKIEAEGNAEAKISEARGTAEATLLQAQAQAKANTELNASLTENVLKRMELEARAKHGWLTMSGVSGIIVDEKK